MYYLLPFLYGRKPRLIVHSHNSFSRYPWQNKIFKPLLNKKVDECLACSKKAADWQFALDKKVRLINVGIDTNRFMFSEDSRRKIRQQLNISDDCLVIGNIGRLTPTKNQKFLIDICSEVIEKRGNVRLIIIGDGELREELLASG